jgi:hypothetical protein
MATSAFYSSTAHTEELMAEYFNVFDEVFEEAALLVTEGKIESRLLGPAAHQGFRRLN